MHTSEPFRTSYTIEPPGRICVFTMAGKLDPLATETLEKELDELYRNGERHFILDLNHLEYVGSVGLRVFIRLANKVKGNGDVRLYGMRPAVRELFEITKLTSLFHIYPSKQEAVDALRSA